MKTIAVVNSKGGCGKTTSAINLAACIGWQGLPVLLVDLDPQGHATLGVNIQNWDGPGLYDVFSNRKRMRDVIAPDVVAGIDLIPATPKLGEAEALLSDWPREKELALKLGQLADDYQYVVIDCPPTLGLLTVNALLAADEVLIPVEMSLFGLDSVDRLLELIRSLERKHDIRIPIRILPTMVDSRTRLARSFLRQIWERFPDQVLPLLVHYTVRIREAICKGVPIIDFAANSQVAKDYRQLAKVYLAPQPARPAGRSVAEEGAGEAVPAFH
jgi:chromosome partitioning protein